MKAALIQSHIRWEDKTGNIAEFENIVSAHPGTDLFLLPEMSFTGFSMNTDKTAEQNRETAGMIAEIAAHHAVSVGFGWARQTAEKCENVYTILDQNGQLISEYVKIHPFSYSGEDRFFKGGDRLSLYTIAGIPFSTVSGCLPGRTCGDHSGQLAGETVGTLENIAQSAGDRESGLHSGRKLHGGDGWRVLQRRFLCDQPRRGSVDEPF